MRRAVAARADRAGGPPPTVWLSVAAYLGVLAVNALANALPLFGRSTGAISDRFPVAITPAGFTFSVWGVIYIGLAAFTLFQALPARRDSAWLEPLRRRFIATCAFNVAWLFAWHGLRIEVSLVAMAGLLATLVAMYVRTRAAPADAAVTWCVRAPVSAYLGWISVASLVNARVVLYDLGWRGGGTAERLLTVLVVVALAALALRLLAVRRDLAYAAVVAWAAFGISAANAGVASVRIAAAAAALVVAAGVVRGVVAALRGRGTA